MDLDPSERSRADYYRKTARQVRERAAELTTPEARAALNSLANDYERLANYVESLWKDLDAPAGPEPEDSFQPG